jgi:hypothetical protein
MVGRVAGRGAAETTATHHPDVCRPIAEPIGFRSPRDGDAESETRDQRSDDPARHDRALREAGRKAAPRASGFVATGARVTQDPIRASWQAHPTTRRIRSSLVLIVPAS